MYVGSCVEPLVDFLCSELAIAFKAEGATLPPWRSADAMLSKWRPRRSVDCDMLQPPVTPFDTASRSGSGGVSRCSLNQRPSKSQRLSSAGSDGGAAPHGSPLKGMGSGRCRSGSNLSAAGFSTGVAWALQKSASNALSDAEAQEAAAAGDASDSSNDSEMETVAGDDWRTGGGGVGRRSDLSKLSSSWRASDTVPFMPASPVSGGLRRASEERTSASDGSDTSQCGPAAPTVALPLRLQVHVASTFCHHEPDARFHLLGCRVRSDLPSHMHVPLSLQQSASPACALSLNVLCHHYHLLFATLVAGPTWQRRAAPAAKQQSPTEGRCTQAQALAERSGAGAAGQAPHAVDCCPEGLAPPAIRRPPCEAGATAAGTVAQKCILVLGLVCALITRLLLRLEKSKAQ